MAKSPSKFRLHEDIRKTNAEAQLAFEGMLVGRISKTAQTGYIRRIFKLVLGGIIEASYNRWRVEVCWCEPKHEVEIVHISTLFSLVSYRDSIENDIAFYQKTLNDMKNKISRIKEVRP